MTTWTAAGNRRLVGLAIVVALGVLGGPWVPAQSRSSDEERRERWQKVGEVLDSMGVVAGASVADIGAGHGFFTARLSRAVGPTGRVLAVDVDQRALGRLRERVDAEKLENVEVITGEREDPKLPPDALDAALIVNAYHEMDAHQSMLGHILEALKPGGRLVLVEPAPRPGRAGDRQAQARSHEIGIEFAEADLEEAGFEIVDRRETFTERDGHGDTEWLLVGRKPAGAVTGGPYQLNW